MKQYSYGVCPYAIKDGEVEILLIQPKGHTEWGFIKGKIDSGETKKDCAVRECLEETNIIVGIDYLEDYYEQVNKKKNVGIFLVDSRYLDFSRIKLEKREVGSIKFFKIKDSIKINKNQSQILQKIKHRFLNNVI